MNRMHAGEERAAWAARPAAESGRLIRGEIGAHGPKRAITVMVASGTAKVHATWLPRLAREPGIEAWRELVTDPAQLAACVEQHLPSVLLLDKALLDGLDPPSLRSIQRHARNVRVLLLWDEICHDLVADVLRNRFHGFLLTSCLPEVCLKAILTVSKGELWLSRASLAKAFTDLAGLQGPGDARTSGKVDGTESLTAREKQVVELLRMGHSNKEIARELGIMEDTVKKHLQSVFAKLGVHRRALVALHRLPFTA